LYYTTISLGLKKGASKGVKRPPSECSKKGRKCYILNKCGERTGRDQYYVVKHRTWYAGISLIGAELRNCPSPSELVCPANLS